MKRLKIPLSIFSVLALGGSSLNLFSFSQEIPFKVTINFSGGAQ